MNIDKYKDYQLCYVSGGDCYFANIEPSKVWGDDWNDAPYEHNAGTPYGDKYDIFKLKIESDLIEPCEYQTNSPYSVEQINQGAVAWLRTDSWCETQFAIQAGTTVEEFIRIVQKHGGSIFVKLEENKWT